jgi:hypothetical protein
MEAYLQPSNRVYGWATRVGIVWSTSDGRNADRKMKTFRESLG